MKRHAGKKVVDSQWQLSELLRRNLRYQASIMIHECYGAFVTTISIPEHCYLDASGLQKTVVKKSLLPAGPVTRTINGPILGCATNSNVKKGQHSLSAAIISAMIEIHGPSPGTRKAYQIGSSSVSITADL